MQIRTSSDPPRMTSSPDASHHQPLNRPRIMMRRHIAAKHLMSKSSLHIGISVFSIRAACWCSAGVCRSCTISRFGANSAAYLIHPAAVLPISRPCRSPVYHPGCHPIFSVAAAEQHTAPWLSRSEGPYREDSCIEPQHVAAISHYWQAAMITNIEIHSHTCGYSTYY